jgi:hypothetical protein
MSLMVLANDLLYLVYGYLDVRAHYRLSRISHRLETVARDPKSAPARSTVLLYRLSSYDACQAIAALTRLHTPRLVLVSSLHTPPLVVVSSRKTPLEDAHVFAVQRMSWLRELSLQVGHLDLTFMNAFRFMKQLERLHIHFQNAVPYGAMSLFCMPVLTVLQMRWTCYNETSSHTREPNWYETGIACVRRASATTGIVDWHTADATTATTTDPNVSLQTLWREWPNRETDICMWASLREAVRHIDGARLLIGLASTISKRYPNIRFA